MQIAILIYGCTLRETLYPSTFSFTCARGPFLVCERRADLMGGGSSAEARTSVFLCALPNVVDHQPVFVLKQGFQICFDHKKYYREYDWW